MGAGSEQVAPCFAVGHGYACFQGRATADGSLHRHAAFQIAIAVRGEVTVVDAHGTRHRAAALVVPPMVRHRMLAVPQLRTFFVDPHCAFADRLRDRCGDGVTEAHELRHLRESDLRNAGGRPSDRLDPRLSAALDLLAVRSLPMPDLAARVGLSPQRLRALARQELGMPLARWRIWRRLARAADALCEGQSLAEAASTGGFADQAHLSRQMREMIGLTPSAVLRALHPSAAPGDVDGDRTVDR
ncbi:helix-turn-helix domain-containing protein [Kitasatospora sp. NBC_00458]|uniref:helix-turn-helix domain-containing protein n=1 Tax=Kitasatospora sp. NBC_00458 TaxID=2903568 RepID=UPI002E1788A8